MVTQQKLQQFCDETFEEFGHLSDYIWKFNLQINELRSVELQKLQYYFPNDPTGQAIRWHYQSQKLDYWFPVMLNYSFVVLVFITIETRLMKACDLISESRTLSIRAKDMAGNGFERYMSFLTKLVGIPRQKLTLWPQISRLATIRNCIVHASGFVEFSNDEKVIRSIAQDRSYLSKEHLARIEKYDKEKNEDTRPIRIEKTDNGERLIIELDYSHNICFYGREFLMQILKEVGLPHVAYTYSL